uniref:Uncharacterized protein n=1 Tax=Arundo donax TaxID=35708 RepID=A0A0A9HMZ2_ARUDO
MILKENSVKFNNVNSLQLVILDCKHARYFCVLITARHFPQMGIWNMKTKSYTNSKTK